MEENNPLFFEDSPIKDFPFASFAIAFTALIVLIYEVIGGNLMVFFPAGSQKSWIPLVNGFAQLILMLIPAIMISRLSPLPVRQIFRLGDLPTAMQLAWAVGGIVAFQFFVTGYSTLQDALIPESYRTIYEWFNKNVERNYDLLLGGKGTLALIRGMLIGAVIPAVCEESLFRGFCQSHLEQRFRPWRAILITAVIFGLVHFNPIGLVPLVSIGFYLGFIAYWTRSLILPVLIHFINNAMAVLTIHATQADSAAAQNAGELPVAWAAVLLLVGLVLMYYAMRNIYLERRVNPKI